MEELSAESCRPDRGNRFLHGAHSDFQRVVLLRTAARQETVVHLNVTAHPTALWTAQQIIEAFPEETAPRFLLRVAIRSMEASSACVAAGDFPSAYQLAGRDQIYGGLFRLRVAGMGIEEVITAAQSPWQNPMRND